MSKFCCVCGREIKEYEPYYCVAPDTYTCYNEKCRIKYYWNIYAEHYLISGQHEYFVVDDKLYRIGSNEDEPRGMGGRFYMIQFEDGVVRDTHSLWYIGDIPESEREIFKQNAHFVQKGN